MTSNQHAALMTAIIKHNLADAKKILQSSELTINEEWTDYFLLVYTLKNELPQLAELLIEKGCRVRSPKNTYLFTPLCYAVKWNNVDLAKKLLEKGASIMDKDLNKQTPLRLALDCYSYSGYSMIDLMLSMYSFKDMDVTSKDEITHFHIAIWRSNRDVVQKFVENGMSVDSCLDPDSKRWPGFTSLHTAVDISEYSVNPVIDFLIKHGANSSAQDAKGRSTPLILAYDKSSDIHDKSTMNNIIDKFILANTFQYSNPVNHQGISHFHIACMRSKRVISLQGFLNHGVDINH